MTGDSGLSPASVWIIIVLADVTDVGLCVRMVTVILRTVYYSGR